MQVPEHNRSLDSLIIWAIHWAWNADPGGK